MMLDDKSKPKVSVVIPIYNAENGLSKCLESVLAQDYKNYEIILVDDGSTDSSSQICLQYVNSNPNKVLYIKQNNSGPASARNNGIQKSRGEYITFVDSDDTISTHMVSDMVRTLEAFQCDMVICAYARILNGAIEEITYRRSEGLYKGVDLFNIACEFINETAEDDIPPYSWVRMIKKTVLDENKLEFQNGLTRSEDFHFWAKVHFCINSLYLLSQSQLYNYYINQNSITHRYITDYWDDVLFIYKDLIEKLPDNEMIKRRLGNMLVRRSRIALNNSCRCKNRKQAKKEIKEIVNNGILQKVISDLTKEELIQYKMFYKLMSHGLYQLVFTRYSIRNLLFIIRKR